MTREEAINKVRQMSLPKETMEILQALAPELRESEDERIRKGLVKLLTVASEAYLVESTGIKKESYLAWLEKQKEPKPSWSEEDETSIAVKNPEAYKIGFADGEAYAREQKEHWKPTEEQMEALLNAEGYLREGDQFDSAKSIAQLYEQLKAIKEDKK